MCSVNWAYEKCGSMGSLDDAPIEELKATTESQFLKFLEEIVK